MIFDAISIVFENLITFMRLKKKIEYRNDLIKKYKNSNFEKIFDIIREFLRVKNR